MMKRITPLLFFLFLLSNVVSAQQNVKDSAISTTMIYATYSYQFPQGGLSKLFGANSSIGGGLMFKTKSNWLIGFEGNYLFGSNVKIAGTVLSGLETKEGFVIDPNGLYADVFFYERGYNFFGKFGKVIPLFGSNHNSGLMIMAGGGYMVDKIRIHTSNNDVPALLGDYVKGYDRLNSGWAVNGSIGYLYLGNTRLLNFYAGFEFCQAWTKSQRDFDFDTGLRDNASYNSQFYGIKVSWFIPFFKRVPNAYYLY
jgi:hypothetical protein